MSGSRRLPTGCALLLRPVHGAMMALQSSEKPMTHVQLRPLQPMTVLGGGRYRLEREVGRGGMATVWLATDTKLNREVAIKFLLGELAFALGPERFRREIEVVSRLSHPHILPIDDYGDYEGQLYYVMPFIAGETIHKRLEREKQLPVQDAVRIAHQVAMALDFAHRQGIVHRDIKPENILLQNGEALVADFGIARAITEGGGAKLTSTGVTLGTPTYMSPEQAMADPALDGRSDIYSLGCVLYEMLAGQPPFTGPTAQAIIARHQLDEAPSLGIVRGTIPEEVEDVVIQAMAKLPGRPVRDGRRDGGRAAEDYHDRRAPGRSTRASSHKHDEAASRARRRAGDTSSSRPSGFPFWRARPWLACTSWGRVGRRKSYRNGYGSESHRRPVLRRSIRRKAQGARRRSHRIADRRAGERQATQGDLAQRCRAIQGKTSLPTAFSVR